MANISDVVFGLKFFEQKILEADDPCAVDAEHDVLYCMGPCPEELTPEEVKELNDRGWRWDKEFDCSWKHYT